MANYVNITLSASYVGATVAHQCLFYDLSQLPAAAKAIMSSRDGVVLKDSNNNIIPATVKNFVTNTSGQIYADLAPSSAANVTYKLYVNSTGGVDSVSAYTNSGIFLNKEYDEASGVTIDDTGIYSTTVSGTQNQTGTWGKSCMFSATTNADNIGTAINTAKFNGATKLWTSIRFAMTNTTKGSYCLYRRGNQYGWGLQPNFTNNLSYFYYGGNTAASCNTSTAFGTSMQQVDTLYDGSLTGNARFVAKLNNAPITLTYTNTPAASQPTLTENFIVGNRDSYDTPAHAYIDSIMISTVWSDGMHTTRYNNAFNHNLLWSTGTLQQDPPSGLPFPRYEMFVWI